MPSLIYTGSIFYYLGASPVTHCLTKENCLVFSGLSELSYSSVQQSGDEKTFDGANECVLATLFWGDIIAWDC